jgi:hypothetical protein
VNARHWGWWESDDWHMWRWLPSCFGCGTSYTMSWVLHMAFCCGRTWVEVLIYKFDADVRAPLRNPRLVALRRVEIFGLHNDWCANLTLLARVRIECKKAVPSCISRGGCGARPIPGQGCGKSIWLWVVRIPSFGIGRVHRSVLGSLYPLKITLPLYTASHFSLSKITLHPTLHRG